MQEEADAFDAVLQMPLLPAKFRNLPQLQLSQPDNFTGLVPLDPAQQTQLPDLSSQPAQLADLDFLLDGCGPEDLSDLVSFSFGSPPPGPLHWAGIVSPLKAAAVASPALPSAAAVQVSTVEQVKRC